MKKENLVLIFSLFPLLTIYGCLTFANGSGADVIYPCDANSECLEGFKCVASATSAFTHGECAPLCAQTSECPKGRSCTEGICQSDDNSCSNPLMSGKNCDQCNIEKGYGPDCTPYGSLEDWSKNIYKTMEIAGGEWMAENYRYKTGNHYESIGAPKNYGLLYDWETATSINFCPKDWRLPLKEDFDKLLQYVAENKKSESSFLALIAESGWQDGQSDIIGTNEFGFSALPIGYSEGCNRSACFHGNGSEAHFWSGTKESESTAFYLHLSSTGTATLSQHDSSHLLSVRCFKAQAQKCGDNAITGIEECDDGNTEYGDGCDAHCNIEKGCHYDNESQTFNCCGNGEIESKLGEQCDDGRSDTGDGCDASCQIESGWTCNLDAEGKSICQRCGNGTVEGTEQCDDGGTNNGDGCDASCQIEENYVCVTNEGSSNCYCALGSYGAEGSKTCYSSFTDPRDNHTYKTAIINGKLWMAENMAFTGTNDLSLNCMANTDEDSEFVKNYGCLYTWADAQKVCPAGWHLPTKDELDALADLKSSDLRATNFMGGSNSSGFSALPAGRYYKGYMEINKNARFWSDDDNDSSDPSNAYSLNVVNCNDNMSNDCATVGYYSKTSGNSVRCVKNAN